MQLLNFLVYNKKHNGLYNGWIKIRVHFNKD